MLVSRRFGDRDVTATLNGARYVVGTAAPAAGTCEEPPAPVPAHLRGTLDALRQAGDPGLTVEALAVATAGAPATLAKHLAALKELGLAVRAGAGTKGAPLVWRAVDAPAAKAAPPTSDPAYVRYLNSVAWAAKRAEVLDRADGNCEDCGDELEPGEAEVHHLTYERVGRELPEDLVALCPGCHRRAHVPA
jgi:hypothetical protein